MEKFYIVKDKSLVDKFVERVNYQKEFNDIVGTYMKEIGVETTEYYMNSQRLRISPTSTDIEKFKGVMNMHGKFRYNSKINKEFIKRAQHIPQEALNNTLSAWECGFSFERRAQSSKFIFNDELYFMLILWDDSEIETPEGLVEIEPEMYYKSLKEFERKRESQ